MSFVLKAPLDMLNKGVHTSNAYVFFVFLLMTKDVIRKPATTGIVTSHMFGAKIHVRTTVETTPSHMRQSHPTYLLLPIYVIRTSHLCHTYVILYGVVPII